MFDVGNNEVWEFQELQVFVVLIRKVAHPVEPQVGQWVGSGGFALEAVAQQALMQIDLGWVVI